jgi:DNA-binding MarR family transcriptional regulator
MPRIYQEIKQSKPYSTSATLAVVTIIRTADVIRHAIGVAVAPFGLTDEQFNALRILRGAGEGGLPTLEVSNRMLSRSPNVTRLLDRLIAKRLVRRSRLKEDRRVVNVSITPQGLELLSHLDGVVDQLIARFPKTTSTEMETLLDVLDKAREQMTAKTAAERSLERGKSGPA